jgi:hypothetical protein
MNTSNWTARWPQGEGMYWFYGWFFGVSDEKPKLHFCEVKQGANKLMFVANGNFMYEREAVGVWLKATLPNYNQEYAQLLLNLVVEKQND